MYPIVTLFFKLLWVGNGIKKGATFLKAAPEYFMHYRLYLLLPPDGLAAGALEGDGLLLW